jgi:McrBC 5-methylcytosine restriction system component
LAELVLRATSVEHPRGAVAVNGFLLDMPKLFEDFVTMALREAVEGAYGGREAIRLPERRPLPVPRVLHGARSANWPPRLRRGQRRVGQETADTLVSWTALQQTLEAIAKGFETE